jgi:hypothetical protein
LHAAAIRVSFAAELASKSIVFVGICSVAVLAYSYIATALLLTNHSFPNSFVYPYPSPKTLLEGRWAADVIIQLTGGSGVQSVQFILAVAVKAVNALLLCHILRVRGRGVIFLVGILLALHPAFLDYYSFTVDDTTFELGDSFALLSILCLARVGRRLPRIAGATVFLVLSIAAYQPKIALSSSLLLVVLATDRLRPENDDRRSPLTTFLEAATALISAVLIYYVSIKLTATPVPGERGHVNSVVEMLKAARQAYREVFLDFTVRVDYLPRALRFIPGLCILMGLAIVLVNSLRRGPLSFILALVAVVLLPIAMQLSYVINNETWASAGRILSVHAYILCAAVIIVITEARIRWIGVSLAVLLSYFFFVVACQENNAAAMKSVFDVAKLNRILSRIESVAPDIYSKEYAFVAIGELGMNPDQRMKRFANKLYGSLFQSEFFVNFRQPEILNFFLGRQAARRPKQSELDAAIAASRERPPWPAAGSVFVQDGVVVVVLKPYAPDVSVSWVSGQ